VPTSSFEDAIADWHDFYMLTAGAAATLLGLLFVAVSLNLRLFSDPSQPRLRADASVTFSSYLYLVLISLVIVAPNPDPDSLGWSLLIFSGIELVMTQKESDRARRLLQSGWRGYLLELAPTLCYLGVMVVAGGSILGQTGLLTDGWMIPFVATLLGTATGDAWDLLLAVGTAQSPSDESP